MKRWYRAIKARIVAAWKRVVAFFLALLVGIGVIAYAETREVSWDHPTERVDGAALDISEIQETRLYCNGSLKITIPAPNSITSPDFGIGDHECYATTVDTDGQESEPSNVVTFTVNPAQPQPPTIHIQ